MPREIRTNLDLLNAAKIVNALDGTNPQDYATVAQLNAAIEGLAPKDSCRVASTANVNISSPGGSIDGISLSNPGSERVLLKDQSTAAENGIYIWNGSAVAMTRSADASTAAELEAAITTIEEGTSNAGTTWRQTAVNFTLGSGSVSWTQFGTGVADASESTAGKIEIATQLETDTGTDDTRAITPLKLATYSNRKLKHTATIGDGSATQYDITHNFNTKEVVVSVRKASDDSEILCDVSRPTVNTVRLNFAAAPSSNSIKVVVLG